MFSMYCHQHLQLLLGEKKKFSGTRFAIKVANDATCVWQLCSKLLNFCDTVFMVASNDKIYILHKTGRCCTKFPF